MSRVEVSCDDGKYTFIFENGVGRILRYGEAWRDIPLGDGAILSLVYHAEALEERLADGWHRASEVLPEEEGDYLVWHPPLLRPRIARFARDHEGRPQWWDSYRVPVTHWRFLPDLPKS